MQQLIAELKGSGGKESPLVKAWHTSLAANLQNKKYLYIADQFKTEQRIDEEQKLQNEVWAAATGRKEVSDLPEHEKTVVVAVTSSATDRGSSKTWDANKYDVVDAKVWKGLVATHAATNKILEAIAARLQKLNVTASWKACVAALINALQQLLDDYPDLSALLQKVVAVVRAFIRAPMVLSKQFLNMLIMGDAGTGKTRLAETVGSVFARLGLYVYEEVVVASANDFIGEFVGQTEQKTADFLSKHAEKVIFLDEAYSLTLWEEKTPGKRQLAGYSPEAVAQLIAVLSQSVGRFLFIAAGYEREMREDFLAANDGFDRRFPIRVVLEAPTNHTLVRAFFGAIAEGVVGPAPPPSAAADLLAWKENKGIVTQAVQHWFSDSAICLLCDVLDAARDANSDYDDNCHRGDEGDQAYSYTESYFKAKLEKEQREESTQDMDTDAAAAAAAAATGAPVPDEPPCTLASMFKAGAGAMVNLAGTAAVLIISSAEFEGLYATDPAERKVVDKRAMRSILLAFISDKHSQSESGTHAANELDYVLVKAGWMRYTTDDRLVWTEGESEVACVSNAGNAPPVKATDIITPDSVRLPPENAARTASGGGGGDQAMMIKISAFVAAVNTEAKRARSGRGV